MSGFTLNHVVISGNLTAPPEVRALPSGTSLCKLRIAVNESVKDQAGNWSERVNYFNVTIWGRLGEWVGRSLTKGSGIAVAGRLRWREWTAEDGSKRQDVEIVADSIMPRESGNGGNGGNGGAQQTGFADRYTPPHEQPVGSGFPAEDDIPF